MSEYINPLFIKYGLAKKSSFEMSREELNEAAQTVLSEVREKAFSKGLPVYQLEKGKLVAVYSDGRIIEAEPEK